MPLPSLSSDSLREQGKTPTDTVSGNLFPLNLDAGDVNTSIPLTRTRVVVLLMTFGQGIVNLRQPQLTRLPLNPPSVLYTSQSLTG